MERKGGREGGNSLEGRSGCVEGRSGCVGSVSES